MTCSECENDSGCYARCNECRLRTRVAELEAQLASATVQLGEVLLKTVAREDFGAKCAELAVSNADRARMRAALNAWESWAASQAEGEPKVWPPFVQSSAALASSDAAAWLHARDMRVAEAVRSACIEAMRVDGTPTGMLRCVMGPFDLAAIIARVK